MQTTPTSNHINPSLNRVTAGQKYLSETAFTFYTELPEYITKNWVSTLHTLCSILSKPVDVENRVEAMEARFPTQALTQSHINTLKSQTRRSCSVTKV